MELIRYHSYYDLYFILNDKIFHRYGMNGTRAEAELQKMFVLKILGKEVLDIEETMGLQQVQAKNG